MKNQEKVGIPPLGKPNKDIWVFECKESGKFSLFTTSNKDINKSISQKKTSVKQSVFTDILKNNNYTKTLLKENIPLNLLQEECSFLERNYKKIQSINDKKKLLELSAKTTAEQVEFGLEKEDRYVSILERYFKSEFKHSKYPYALFDFYDQRGFLYDLKFYKYSYDKYSTEIISTNKALSSNCIFVFIHQEIDNKVRLFWIRYDYNLFGSYERFWCQSPNRLGTTETFRIPKCDLKEFIVGEKNDCELVPDPNEVENVLNILVRDQNRAKNCVSHNTINFVMTKLESI